MNETIGEPIQDPIRESIGKPNEQPVMMEYYTVFEVILIS